MNQPFSDEFKKHTQDLTDAKCHYGLIEHDHWYQPEWIDEEKATAARQEMINKQVIYGHSVPYRNMCRFNSGVSLPGRYADGDEELIRSNPQVLFPAPTSGFVRLLLAHRVSLDLALALPPPELSTALTLQTKHQAVLRHRIRPLPGHARPEEGIRVHHQFVRVHRDYSDVVGRRQG